MKAFVINLDKDKQRLHNFYNSFKHSKFIQIQRIPGIYGKDIDSSQLTTLCHNFCSNGIKGCFASHKSVWKKIKDENIQSAIIFEDDAVPIQQNYEDLIKQQIKNTPKDFDIIVLHNTLDKIQNIPIYQKLILQILGLYNYSNKKINTNVYKPQFTYELVSYIVSNKGARKLLSLFPKINYHVDVSVFKKYNQLNIYSVKNPIFKQSLLGSNNISDNYTHFNYQYTPLQLILKTTFLKLGHFNINAINISYIFISIFLLGILTKKIKLSLSIITFIILSIIILFRLML